MTRAIIVREKRRRSGRLNFRLSFVAIMPRILLIRATLIAIDRGAIVSVRPIGFVLHCRRNKSPGFGFAPDERADKCRRRRRRRRQWTDAKIVIFGFRSYFFGAGDKPAQLSAPCTREIRRAPDDFRRWSFDVRGGIDPDTPLWDIELFFFSPFFLRRPVVPIARCSRDTKEHPSVQRSCT